MNLTFRQREKKVRIDEQISSYERENRRLQDTVYQLQDRNDRRMRDNGASQGEKSQSLLITYKHNAAVRHELRRTQDEYGNRFADLQRDLDNLRKNPPAQALVRKLSCYVLVIEFIAVKHCCICIGCSMWFNNRRSKSFLILLLKA